MDGLNETSVNRPFSDDLDDFNDITIWYIGTDASLAELHTELSINATLKPLDAFVFKYRTQDTLTAEEKVPAEYHKYLDVCKEEVERFPESRPWDHAIKMKPGFKPRVFKSYNLTLKEHEQQELFVKETSRRDISDHQDHQWHPPSSLSTRKMGNCDQHRITGTSTNGRSRTPICCHSYQKS